MRNTAQTEARIYLDYAATTPLREEVSEAMRPLLQAQFGNPDSLHSFGREAAYAVQNARDTIAALLGVKPRTVYFTSGGTEAGSWAVQGIAAQGAVCVSAIEHAAVLQTARRCGRAYQICSVAEDGVLRPQAAEAMLQAHPEISLFCLMAVNNETGCVQPVEEVAALCHARGVALFVDCVQAQATCDLKKLAAYADALALSAHKIGGPKGVGALVVKDGVPLKALIMGGEQERGMRGGTLNAAGIAGFARALALAQAERKAFCAHTAELRDAFEGRITRAYGGIFGDGANRAPNVSHLTPKDGDGALLSKLDLAGVACSAGAACSAHAALPSHVLTAMGRSADEARRGLRFSFGAATTAEEACRAADILLACIGEGRR